MRIFGVVSYNGYRYNGWQKQPDAITVQGELEACLSRLLNTPIVIYGSGRTDAGVHALGQTFHFDVDKEVDLGQLRYSLNSIIANDIYVKELKQVDDSFHARYSAKGKVYCYKIQTKERDVFRNHIETNILQDFDVNKFKEALKLFVGKHDFKDFTSKEEDEDNFIREIYNIDVLEEDDNRISVTIKGNGFMRYMIRFIIGTALVVARDKESLEYISYHLSDKSLREIGPYKAPAEGLYLVEVIY